MRSKQVLMIVTGHGTLGDTGKATGLYLSELAHPYEVLSKAGHKITIASPAGGNAPIDPKSISPELEPFAHLAKNTKSLHSIGPNEYDAYMVVGGHGAMWDLPENADLQRIIPAAFEQEKIVAAVCHGPAALTKLKNAHGTLMIAGRKVTGFTNEEESTAGLAGVMPFLLEDELRNAGAVYLKAPKWQANIVVDGLLVTGQNPASAKGVGEAVASLLALSEAK